jgi:hypothetical protein
MALKYVGDQIALIGKTCFLMDGADHVMPHIREREESIMKLIALKKPLYGVEFEL